MTTSSVVMDMVHSEDDLRHGLQHLLSDGLEGHETMTIFRNVRKKYAKEQDDEQDNVKEGLRGMETFRTPEQGVLAAYRSSVCESGPKRAASALYVTVNPRNVSEGLTSTHREYVKWIENKAGITKEQVRRGDREDYRGTLDKMFDMHVLKSQSRQCFGMIDVDDKDPETWLKRVREAIGDDAIEMIVETKNGYHVIYKPKRMNPQAHQRLAKVLQDSPKGPDEKATKCKGSSINCALPGGMQADHKTRIFFLFLSNEQGRRVGFISSRQ